MRFSVSLVVIGCTLCSVSSAGEIYVNNLLGNDMFNGAAPTSSVQGSGPCRTIRRALELAQFGDRIILADTGEPYRESVTLQGGRHSGTRTQPFVIEGNGAVLDGSRPVPKNAWGHFRDEVFHFQPPLTSFQQFFLDSRPAVRVPVENDDVLPDLEPFEWCLFQRRIYFRVEKGGLPQDYDLSYTSKTVGITLYEVRNVAISDLYVQGFQLDGVNAHDSAFAVLLSGLVCQGNGRSGISVGGASRVIIEACLAHYNGAAQVRTEGFCKAQILNCNLVEADAPGLVREGGEVVVVNEPSDE